MKLKENNKNKVVYNNIILLLAIYIALFLLSE